MTEMPPYLAGKDEESSVQVDSDSSDLEDDLPLAYDKPRHSEPIKGEEREEHTWRVKEKYKTHCVALVLCLNVGVDPPDVVKTQPCARLECWIDPNSLSPSKALESIGHALQSQYERWQPRARYKQSLDPTSEEIKKLCCSLRRNAKEERVLFHYNGHGVPKPTAQGEIWVFNRAYTQYIPLSIYDLQTWMGAPSLYVYDCSNAGVIVDNFKLFAEQHERDYEKMTRSGGSGTGSAEPHVSYRNCIQLGACAAGQALPMSPDLPADLFTACLTTPVKMAVKWFALRTRLRVARADLLELVDKIPGQVTDRRTMLGELNWIFTAITDTIAWSSLPAELFQRLFRADLLTASLCRNFLLADRIMRSYNCTPVSAPALPSLARHPLWGAWEHTLDLALAQLPALVAGGAYVHAPFFRDQLTAFRLWLGPGAGARPPPLQLPMVLQVLLSTLHRVRALQILCRFLALGPPAVRAVLAVGIFPYMLKLLQASAPDLRNSMVYIWAKIIAVDPSCQVDLVNAKGHKYFLAILQDPSVDSEHRTLAAFVLAGIVDKYPAGQEAALQGSLISACLEQLGEARCGCGALAVWACVALGRLWRGHEAARWAGVRDLAHEKLFALLPHPRAPVRAAVAFALGTFAPAALARTDHANALDHQVAVRLAARLPVDTSPLVRAEILAALQWIVLIFEQHFIAVYLQDRVRRTDKYGVMKEARDRNRTRVDPGQDALAAGARAIPFTRAAPIALPAIGFGSVYTKLWGTLCDMAREPHPELSRMAKEIIEYVANQADTVDAERSGFMSQPSSPNTRAAHANDARTHTLPGGRRGKTGLPHTISEDSVHARDRDSFSSTSSHSLKKPIVSTQFVEWATAQFARGEGGESGVAGCSCSRAPPQSPPPTAPLAPGPLSPLDDCESAAYHERMWRKARNASIRKEARALRGGRAPRLETQAFHSRCPLPPAVVLFHPYEQHAAVASKDNFGVWDWGTAAKLCPGKWERSWGRITSLAYLNAHARALLAVASHAGNVAVYRPGSSGAEPALVGAWRALDVRPAPDYRPPPAQPIYSFTQLVSEQWSTGDEKQHNKNKSADSKSGAMSAYNPPPPATLLRWGARGGVLALGGAAPALRLWDARAELLLRDVPTGSEAPVTALWLGGDTALAGFGDGAVRAWDTRASDPLFALPPLAARVLCAAPRPDLHALVAGGVDGEVRIYDTRKLSSPVHTVRAPAPLAALDVHPRADLLACGSVNQCISIYDLRGAHLNTIKFHEGFMGARIGPVSCLAFHPLRCALGVGAKDATVSVYVAEARR